MKRDKSFYLTFVMICFAVFYVVSFVLLNRTIAFGNLVATASILIYPITYFIATLFAEKYGKDKLFNMLVYSVVALLFCAVIIAGASLLPIYNSVAGMNDLIAINFRLVFAFIAASLVGQFLNITIYYFLDKKKSFNFLISSVIAITVDSLLFVALAYIGDLDFSEIVKYFSGQYVLSVVVMVLYSLCFAYLINALIRSKKRNEDMENLVLNHSNMVKASPIKKEETSSKTIKDDSLNKKHVEVKNSSTNKKVKANEKDTAKKPAVKKTSTKKTSSKTSDKKTNQVKKATKKGHY